MTDDLFKTNRQTPISVSELNRRARTLWEGGLTRLWLEGEISNLARPASGHLYFSLKDDTAQIRCAWFRQRQRGQARDLANGEQ
ncbi:MAG: exodeoxyribonuclease VII large subunit, partial [Thiohalocapsa sp.]